MSFSYEFLPLLDGHNKKRQNTLALERKWSNRDCWFRLLTYVVGLGIVDMHAWYRHIESNNDENEHKKRNKIIDNIMSGVFDIDADYELQIRNFSEKLRSSLENLKMR